MIRGGRLLTALLLIGCTFLPQSRYLNFAREAAAKKDWTTALDGYERVIKVAPETEEATFAAKEGARIAEMETQDYKRQALFLRHVVSSTKDLKERSEFQSKLGMLYLEKLNDYVAATTNLNRAIDMVSEFKSQVPLRFALAKAHFFKNEYFQAKSEVEVLLRGTLDEDQRFRAELLKANILSNEKDLDEAIEQFRRIIKQFPDRAKEEQVGLSLAVCYEEKEDFNNAIEVLLELREQNKDSDIIDLKIRRLRERQAQAPGAKGLRK